MSEIEVRSLGLCDYTTTWQAMRSFTHERDPATTDQLWLLEHNPVFTLGQAGKREHLLAPGDIPVVESDRGGQVTYHGPGQAVAYVLLDLHRLGIGIRQLVEVLENTIIAIVAEDGLEAVGRRDAPGVYVNGEKLAALGLRVSKGRTYHGLSLNVDMDLQPFNRINPCGFADLAVTSLAKLGIKADTQTIGNRLAKQLPVQLGKICL